MTGYATRLIAISAGYALWLLICWAVVMKRCRAYYASHHRKRVKMNITDRCSACKVAHPRARVDNILKSKQNSAHGEKNIKPIILINCYLRRRGHDGATYAADIYGE